MSELSPDVERTFGKILLFGEYTILLEGNALAIPLQNSSFSGTLIHGKQEAQNPVWEAWLKYLLELRSSHLQELDFDWERLVKDVDTGIRFESSIPIGYGLGSSGALTAAVFKHYISQNQWPHLHSDLNALQNILALFESFFHGSSSGLDPLVSILNAPIHIQGPEIQSLPEQSPKSFNGWYLVDSGLSRQTSKLVEAFRLKVSTDPDFKIKILELKTINNQVIQDFLEPKNEPLKVGIRNISTIQFMQMDWLIPENIKSGWREGLETNQFYFKLCGAGGGGFFLLYAPEKEAILSLSKQLRILSLNPDDLQVESKT